MSSRPSIKIHFTVRGHMSTRRKRMSLMRSNHALHVRSDYRAQEAQRSHRTVSCPAGTQEGCEECYCLTPVAFDERDAPARNHNFLALTRWILADQRRQL